MIGRRVPGNDFVIVRPVPLEYRLPKQLADAAQRDDEKIEAVKKMLAEAVS